MVDVIGAAFVVVSAVLLFAGAALSIYGVGLVGVLLGGGGAYLVAPTVAGAFGLEGLIGIAAVVLVGAVVGGALTYALLSVAIAGVSFFVGGFVGLAVLAPALVGGTWFLEWGVAVGSGVVAAFFGLIMTKTAMRLITAFVGAALASRAITPADFAAAQAALTPDPLLFDLSAPLVLGLFALGVLTQLGLFKFGYVTKLVGLLPGARPLRDRGRAADPEK